MEFNQDLESEYTPSLFAKRFASRDELLSYHQEFAKKESEKNRFKYNCRLNVSYGPSFREKLDIYGDDLKGDNPLFVYIHGGYWQMMNKWDSAYCVAPLVENGIRVIVIDYELCPQVTLGQIVGQVKVAFQWIANYVAKKSIKSVSFAGHSAGAHLLACCLCEEILSSISRDVQLFAYCISGIYDLGELRHLKAANENNILSLNDNNVRILSPQFYDFRYLINRNIQIFIFAGELESKKFQQQSKDFSQISLKNLPSNSLQIIPDRDHFDIVEKLSESDYEVTKLFIENAKK